jgi:SAM-dependent methyltransferase
VVDCREIYGADVWEEALKEAHNKGIITKNMDFNKDLSFPSSCFDVATSHQVLEHLFFPSHFIKEIYRILKEGGYAVISTENLSSWDNIISLLLGYTPFSMEFDQVKIGNPFSPHSVKMMEKYPPHVRVFSFQGLIDLVRLHGFKLERVSPSGYLPFDFFANVDPRHARFLTLKVRK